MRRALDAGERVAPQRKSGLAEETSVFFGANFAVFDRASRQIPRAAVRARADHPAEARLASLGTHSAVLDRTRLTFAVFPVMPELAPKALDSFLPLGVLYAVGEGLVDGRAVSFGAYHSSEADRAFRVGSAHGAAGFLGAAGSEREQYKNQTAIGHL